MCRIVISQAVILLYYSGCSPAAHVFCEKHFCRGVSPAESVVLESGTTTNARIKKQKSNFIFRFSSKGNFRFLMHACV